MYQDLVQRSLYEVGELWERGHVSVATEHLATAITESLLTWEFQPPLGQKVSTNCVPPDRRISRLPASCSTKVCTSCSPSVGA